MRAMLIHLKMTDLFGMQINAHVIVNQCRIIY